MLLSDAGKVSELPLQRSWLWPESKRTPFPFWPWRASSVKIGSWRMS
jgi:hypothetical protein